MNKSIIVDWREQLGLSERRPPEFFHSLEAINTGNKSLPQAHAMRRAWKDLELDGILCVNNAPYIYFKEVSGIDYAQMRELHRHIWNQGIAPLLVVVSPTEIQVYSGLALPAKDEQKISQQNRLVQILNRVADEIELRQFIRAVELGELFREKPKSFKPDLRVDRYLLKNLADARRSLLAEEPVQTLDIRTVNALLWRTIFTCYLVDRKIIDCSYFHKIGATDCHRLIDLLERNEPNEAKRLLYALFQQLKSDFNGDLFDVDLQAENQLIKYGHINILKQFLRGDDLSSDQLSLGFWVYDFSVIPIETISSIYEHFLETQEKRESGIYYTPRFLAEIVLDTALDGWTSLLEKRFLDPACGSGIFLVAIFNRLAEEWRIKHRNISNDNEELAPALINILQQNIFGIDADSSETACRIAAFSLYLAFLDQLDPRDIQRLQKKGNALPKLVGHNLICKDFFAQDLPISANEFDLIVGNPPWAKVTGKKSLMEQWCQKEKHTIAQRQLASGFVWKAPQHLRDEGRICFLLPAGVLFNHQDKALEFQNEWLSTYTIEQVINLSDMRFYLFDGADRPTIIVRYRKEKPDRKLGSIEYITPKTELETIRAEILSISPDDQKKVRLREVLYDLNNQEAALVWKHSFWGTPRDRKFLERLSDLPRLDDLVDTLEDLRYKERTKRWLMGRGFQPNGKILSPWTPEKWFLDGRNKDIDLIVFETDCTHIGNRFKKLFRLPNQDVFTHPHIIVSKSLKVAFADFDVVFQDALRGIHGKPEDTEIMIFLTVALNSVLAKYFLFHTASTWGIERGDVRGAELLRFPFPLPEMTQNTANAKEIVKQVVEKIGHLKNQISHNFLLNRQEMIQNEKNELIKYIYEYYDIDEYEQILIDDTINISIPSIQPNRGTRLIPTLLRSEPQERKEYLKLLCDVLNTWARKSQYTIIGNIIVSTKMGAAIIVLDRKIKVEQNWVDIEQDSTQELDEILQRIIRLLPNQQGSMSFLRNLKVFDQEKLYIFKPLTRRFWTKTSALNDADEIASAILTSKYEES
ncbi:HsdM family class I SAM-dependent methyltransferase [Sphaerospermopsis torques-reginae]|uniref:site-specific DNA-methyltransferase (adenine-specific) n=1 Tax=Sphaerospermopsis torques-reginae ITEP-024 TaxID=984208 RepID=A0ABX8X161_9CYAN|nr:N-6 DNA methylase [Sphaerospermopsis torques-reginae]QYX32447.1 SAM-dependent methyltransferase [Sphaerospermopsis torques-reginae ITEP-024]